MENNIEMGIYFNKSDTKIYEEMMNEVNFIIKESKQRLPIKTEEEIINKQKEIVIPKIKKTIKPKKYLYGEDINANKKEKANSKWTDEEQKQLINEFQFLRNKGVEQKSVIKKIAKIHERSENAIRRRLKKFEYIK